MPLTEKEKQALQEKLDLSGMPAKFQGDRLAAFGLGIDVVLHALGELEKGIDTPPPLLPENVKEASGKES